MDKFNHSTDIVTYEVDLALEIFLEDLKANPALASIKEKYLQDTMYTLDFLGTSVSMEEPILFVNYMKWFGSLAFHLKFTLESLKQHFTCVMKILSNRLEESLYVKVSKIFQLGIDAFDKAFSGTDDKHVIFDAFLNHLIAMESDKAYQIVLEEIDKGMSIKDVYLKILQPTLYKVGDLWHQRVISVAKEHYITAAIQNMIGKLYSKMFVYREKSKRSITAVCAGDEMHEIGMRMVADFFEVSNRESYFLGSNLPVSTVIDQLIENPTDVLAISATTSQHLIEVKQLINIIKSNDHFKKYENYCGWKGV